jgi:hypothetical protein
MGRFALVSGLAFLGVFVAPLPVAAAGGSLTVPAQVQVAPGARVTVQVTFSYTEVAPFCTNGVAFTWDGVSWLSELPSMTGSRCVATGAGLPPTGHDGAGAHTICGTVGSTVSDCKSLTVVATSAAPTGPAAGAPAPRGSAPAPGQSAAPAPTGTPITEASPLTPVAAGLARIRTLSGTLAVLLALVAIGLVFAVGILLRLRRPRTGAGAALAGSVPSGPGPGLPARMPPPPPDPAAGGEESATPARVSRFGPSGGRGRQPRE